jgi:hypothetical protein
MVNYFMGKVLYFLVNFILAILGFELLKPAKVMDVDCGPGIEFSAKFIVMIIVLIAITRCGLKVYVWLSGYKNK